ncbi:MAG: glycosyltransferase [Candidatus Competibacter phosphatis]
MISSTVGENAIEPYFIVFSDDWGVHPSSCQHLFRQVAASHRVLWVNTIGMRNPTLSWTDAKKAMMKVSRMLRRARSSGEGSSTNPKVDVCQPAMLPFSSLSLVRYFNRHSVVTAVRGRTRALGMDRPVIVSTVPNACDYIESLDRSYVVYYCVDDFTQWPGLQHDLVREMEGRLVAQADLLVATSEQLYRRLVATGKPSHLLSHGVDLDLFGQPAQEEHPCLAGVARPRAGYFGLFDERSDQRLLAALAARMKDFSFVLTGPVAVNVAGLAANPNIRFTGAVNYEELPKVIAGLDVLILPYVVNDFTATISPLKLKEYLVTGRPVVSTPIAEAKALREHVMIAGTLDDWIMALRSALAEDTVGRRRRMLGLLRDDTWAAKAETFISFCSC